MFYSVTKMTSLGDYIKLYLGASCVLFLHNTVLSSPFKMVWFQILAHEILEKVLCLYLIFPYPFLHYEQ